MTRVVTGLVADGPDRPARRMSRGRHGERADIAAGTTRRAVLLFRPYRARVALIVLEILAASALWVVVPFLTKAIFDRALFGADGVRRGLLALLVAGMVVVPLVASMLNFAQTYLTTVVGNRVMEDLRNRLFRHLQSMHFGFFTATRTGEIQSRLANDVGGIQSTVTQAANTILSNVATVTASLAGMVLLSPTLTLLAVGLLPLFVVLQLHVGRIRQRVAAGTQSSLSDMSAITQESLSVSGVLLTKVFNRQELEIARYRRENATQAALQIRQAVAGQRLFAVVFGFMGITPAMVYLLAGLDSSDGRPGLTAGTLVAFTALQGRLMFPVVQLFRVSLEMQTSLALFDRIFRYLDLAPQVVEAPDARPLPAAAVIGEVAFRHVWFRYPTAADPEAVHDRPGWALRDVTLEVRPGQLAAVVGPSGAGKTTLSYLIPRLYDPDRGQVLLDGQDVRTLTCASLVSAIGTVTQETYLFHASIRDNLRYADLDATEDQLIAAARAANIHDRIRGFPEGYDTVVGERGFRLSGGERQRLAIARVILKDPAVLVLDEATSALDTASERLVQDALERVMCGRTTIAIAHRLSTILAADVIFAIQDGRVVERGTHEELLRAGGLYATLCRQQFGDGRSPRPRAPGEPPVGGGRPSSSGDAPASRRERSAG
jgi:ATP-binding cassette subfamily B protein